MKADGQSAFNAGEIMKAPVLAPADQGHCRPLARFAGPVAADKLPSFACRAGWSLAIQDKRNRDRGVGARMDNGSSKATPRRRHPPAHTHAAPPWCLGASLLAHPAASIQCQFVPAQKRRLTLLDSKIAAEPQRSSVVLALVSLARAHFGHDKAMRPPGRGGVEREARPRPGHRLGKESVVSPTPQSGVAMASRGVAASV